MKENNWSMISQRSHDQDQDNYWNESSGQCHDQHEDEDCNIGNVRSQDPSEGKQLEHDHRKITRSGSE